MFAASKTDGVSGGYQISRSLRFNPADASTVRRTFSTTGTSQTTSTFSMWFKRGDINRTQRLFDCYDGSSGSSTGIFLAADFIQFDFGRASGGTLTTTQVLRDTSAWYHLVAVADSTNATASNRMRLYLNGSQITSFSNAVYPAQNALCNWMSANANNTIGTDWSGGGSFLYSGYMTEINFIDGQALTPSSFGETNAQTGVWQPKAYSGSYGTNGFYLNFSDNSNTTAATLGKDYSGNGNNWTPNNFSVTAGAGNDSLVDSPTSYGTDTGVGGTVRGNYSTLNPLDNGGLTISNGNLQFDKAASGWVSARSTMGLSSGKWYWEVTATANSGTFYCMVGVALNSATLADYFAASTTGWAYSAHDGGKYNNASYTAYGSTWTTGDVIGIAFDADAGTLTFYKNNTSQGTAYTGLTSGPYIPAVSLFGTQTAVINFGQRPFAYTAPSGFKALCTQNLPTPVIGATTATQAGKYFNPVLYTGNGGTQSVTGVGFQPDFTWVKNRSAANGHGFEDVLRGAGYTLASDSTSAEINYSNYFTAFTSDGFNMALGGGTFNNNGSNYVAWNWKANGSGSTNTAGSITSTVSANTTSGFSVVTYTGTSALATVGHGLGAVPSMVIVKSRNNVVDWVVYHASLGINYSIALNSTASPVNTANYWGSSAPTSTTFGVNVYGGNGASGYTYVAYCFAEVAGYSKIGSYTGNGSADGPFVYCGFRPAYLMIRRSDSNIDWFVWDSARSTYNVADKVLYPNGSYAEAAGTAVAIDFLSNGFKIRNTDSSQNASGGNYIFAAFATAPFKYSLAR